MFDSHCHLHDPRMAEVQDEALRRARAAGVRGMLLAGVDQAGWADEDRLARAHPDLAVAYGVHPQVVALLDEAAAQAQVAALAAVLDGRTLLPPAALGELGLDARTPETAAALPLQEAIFRAQLALAREHELPLVLHILHAHPRALEILRRDGVPRPGGVVHSYSGSADQTRDYLALGLSLSFAGPVTYPNARRVRAAARAVPRPRLLIETDAPFQTPAPHRPGPNEPAFLSSIAAALATIREEPLEELMQYTEDNARRLFGLA